MSKLGDYVSIKASKKELHGEKFWLLNLDMVEQQTGQVLDYLYVPAAELNGSIVQFDTDCVLYSKLRPNLNKVVLPQTDGYATSEMLPLRPNTAVLSREYLAEYLRSDNFVNWAVSKTAGAKMPRLGTKELLSKDITLPPMEEQTKIVALFQEIARLITLNKQQLIELDNLVKSRFIELFGDPVLNQKGFPCYTVNDIIDFQGGSQPDKKYFEYTPSESNIRLIQIRDYKTDKYITYIPKAMAKRFCTADDIMIGRYGPPIFQILKGIEGSFNVALMKATPKKGNKEFIRHFLKQDCLLHYLEGLSQRTAGQDGIQMDKLKAYPFPYPPMELQNEFAAFVEHTDKLKLAVTEALAELETLKKSLMQQYFG